MEIVALIAVAIVALAAGGAAGYVLKRGVTSRAAEEQQAQIAQAKLEAERILAEAQVRQKEVVVEAEKKALDLRNQAEAEVRERRNDVQQQEKRLRSKEESLDAKTSNVEARERALNDREREIDTVRAEAEEARSRQLGELERVAGLTRDEAKETLISAVEAEARIDATRRLHVIEDELKETAVTKTREVLITAIQRMTQDVTAETTVSVVPIPSEEMKGRIIGREGRNIRALEAATGCDLIIDDTPEAVTLSAFDPVRRQVAKVALQRLIADGRMHPARIEEVVSRVRQEIEAEIREEGERMVFESGVHGLHPELVRLLGRMKYRYSYGQNLQNHSLEVGHMAGMIASELGLDFKLAKRGGLLHDIGKVSDYDVEGPHALIGGDIVRRFGQNEDVINAVAAHHYEVEAGVYAVIAATADAISGGRPGARRESLDLYIKRLESLERLM
jgi:ribonuclease Y